MQSPSPERYNVPLSGWGHVWRTSLCLAFTVFVWYGVAPKQWEQAPGLFWLDLGLGLTSYVLVFFRRRWPVPIAALLTLFGAVSATSAGPGVLAVVSMATGRRIWQIVFIGALNLGCSAIYNAVEPKTTGDSMLLTYSVSVIATVALLVMGMYIGSRRELVWTLRERAVQAEDQQELRISQARSNERERIAREMHDVLAHRISLVTMHAGALAYRKDLPPEQVREIAELIQAKAHEALADLREVLGVLRGDEAPHDRPQPTLADLPALVEEAVASGMTIQLSNSVQGLPDGLGRTIYRIVQEGLTNARKHAPGTHVEVDLAGLAGDGVEIWLRNPTRVGTWQQTPGAGLGLVGLRERAELAGGTLDVTANQKMFALHGWLPWPA